MKTLQLIMTSLISGSLMFLGTPSYAIPTAKSKVTTADKSTTSQIEVINDFNSELEIKLTRDYQVTPGVVKQAPPLTATIPLKQKSQLLDIGNVPNSCFTLNVRAKGSEKWHKFTCVLEFPNIPPYKTEVMCETDVGGDMYISASGHQIQVRYITPNENAPGGEDNSSKNQ